MSRKPTKGYFVRGQFVAEGSAQDLSLKRELKGDVERSKTDMKRESEALQQLGQDLLTLRADLLARLALPEKLADALAGARRITDFEGRRRQMQFVGKLMRKLAPDALQAARAALTEQRQGAAHATLALHEAEQWRDRLIADDQALAEWLAHHPGTDAAPGGAQRLRALVRQARKDGAPTPADISRGQAPRRGRAYRELFQFVRDRLSSTLAPHGDETTHG